jgi:glycerophosphoryl diester phosphodiesterase
MTAGITSSQSLSVSVPTGRPMILGHRGARRRAPENTIKAFQLALDEGADGVELDVRATRDGALVVYHDDTLDIRGTLCPVASLTASEVLAARSFDATIPTLEEVLTWQDQSGSFLNVEIKGDGPEPLKLAERVVSLLRGRTNTLVSSFHPLIVESVVQALPEVPVAQLVERDDGDLLKRPDLLATRAIHPNHALVDSQSIRDWRANGLTWIGVWTVNDPARAVELAKLGVDVIISDCPGVILAALSRIA